MRGIEENPQYDGFSVAILAVEPTDTLKVRVIAFASSSPDSSITPESQHSLHQFNQSIFIAIHHHSSVEICCDGRSPCLLCIIHWKNWKASGVAVLGCMRGGLID